MQDEIEALADEIAIYQMLTINNIRSDYWNENYIRDCVPSLCSTTEEEWDDLQERKDGARRYRRGTRWCDAYKEKHGCTYEQVAWWSHSFESDSELMHRYLRKRIGDERATIFVHQHQ